MSCAQVSSIYIFLLLQSLVLLLFISLHCKLIYLSRLVLRFKFSFIRSSHYMVYTGYTVLTQIQDEVHPFSPQGGKKPHFKFDCQLGAGGGSALTSASRPRVWPG